MLAPPKFGSWKSVTVWATAEVARAKETTMDVKVFMLIVDNWDGLIEC